MGWNPHFNHEQMVNFVGQSWKDMTVVYSTSNVPVQMTGFGGAVLGDLEPKSSDIALPKLAKMVDEEEATTYNMVAAKTATKEKASDEAKANDAENQTAAKKNASDEAEVPTMAVPGSGNLAMVRRVAFTPCQINGSICSDQTCTVPTTACAVINPPTAVEPTKSAYNLLEGAFVECTVVQNYRVNSGMRQKVGKKAKVGSGVKPRHPPKSPCPVWILKKNSRKRRNRLLATLAKNNHSIVTWQDSQ